MKVFVLLTFASVFAPTPASMGDQEFGTPTLDPRRRKAVRGQQQLMMILTVMTGQVTPRVAPAVKMKLPQVNVAPQNFSHFNG